MDVLNMKWKALLTWPAIALFSLFCFHFEVVHLTPSLHRRVYTISPTHPPTRAPSSFFGVPLPRSCFACLPSARRRHWRGGAARK